ncbi:VOC family protein [Streptomyces sp. NPDC005899]|uniref:VOC family protein n=1 Tax=Streptomyces sp. NPDC005899 TaxID=3155716 RepID=UPI003404C7C5
MITARSHLRIARPSRDLTRAEAFWVQGLGMSALFRGDSDGTAGTHDLLMVGLADASWHLELTSGGTRPVEPRPTEEDLLVVYLDAPVPDELVARLQEHGGKRVQSPNPYWNTWGVTVEDPDGYRLVLSTRAWSNS